MSFNSRYLFLILAWIVVLLVIAYLAFYFISMRNVNEPPYTLISHQGNIQLRHYPPILVAEVRVSGEREEAINKGFRLLANYIFGNNTATTPESKHTIQMTAPVIQQASQKIAMTAPVSQTSQGGQWLVRFVMPEKYTMQTIPKPNNPKVKLIQTPPENFAVIRFSGTMSRANLAEHLSVLELYIEKHNLQTSGAPIYAFYNPPWTMPFMRRNEIMLKLESLPQRKAAATARQHS